MAEEKKNSKKSIKLKISNPFSNIKFKKPTLESIQKSSALKTVGLVLLVVIAFALIDLLVQYLNNDYSVAVVNGERISRDRFHDRMETAYGEATSQQLIDETIIRQEAEKSDVEVTDEEVNTTLDEIITSVGGQEAYESALESSNLTEAQLKDQIRVDELTRKILGPQVTYTDEDLKEFFDQYSEIIFPEESAALEEGEKLDFDSHKEEVKDVYIQQQVETLKSSWLDEKATEYRVQNNVTEKPKYGMFTTTVNIVKNLIDNVNENVTE